tara:strand:- start:1043 stop:1834 length:792 start_codon:yes stop_codon:yes gene_type:complete
LINIQKNSQKNINFTNQNLKKIKIIPNHIRLKELQQKVWLDKCTCEGLGWVGFHFNIKHPDFGKYAQCICQKSNDNKYNILKEISNLPAKKTFNDFNISLNETTREAFNTCFDWSEGNGNPFLTLYGEVGVGKTHLAIAAGYKIISRKESVTYYSSSELMRKISSGMNNNGLSKLMEETKSANCLILDDLGREYSTDWSTSLYHEIIDYRYQKKLRTLFTTNNSIQELEKFLGIPAVSRLMDLTYSNYLVIKGKDIRTSIIPK